MAIVEFRETGYSVSGRAILRGFSLAVNEGETVVLLGRSGSGKTTALKLVNALLRPASGEVLVEGQPTTKWDPIRLRRRTGYVIQESGLFPHWTVEENIGLVPRLEGWDKARIAERVRLLLGQLGMEAAEFGRRYPHELSGGQRQRVGIARALAAEPDLLLFDEPFGALDPLTRFEQQNQFLELRRQFAKTALFVTHDVREALRLGTRIVLVADGRAMVDAPPEEFSRSTHPDARAFLETAQ